jgi:Uncharacterized protein conserved in bacteria (DUF2325)
MSSNHARGTSSSRARIRIAVVGGLSRATELWSRAGDEIGVELEHHDGRAGGRRSRDIVAAVRRADLVVIITDPNSHAGVAVAGRGGSSAGGPKLLGENLRPDGIGALIEASLAAARAEPARR